MSMFQIMARKRGRDDDSDSDFDEDRYPKVRQRYLLPGVG
jgi:hypothetical protein